MPQFEKRRFENEPKNDMSSARALNIKIARNAHLHSLTFISNDNSRCRLLVEVEQPSCTKKLFIGYSAKWHYLAIDFTIYHKVRYSHIVFFHLSDDVFLRLDVSLKLILIILWLKFEYSTINFKFLKDFIKLLDKNHKQQPYLYE